MRILFITHQLSRTGAPIVLMDVIKFYKDLGCGVEVISMEDGPLKAELTQDGILVSIIERFWPVRDIFAKAASDYDLVWANTLITYEAVLSLIGTDIPVVWWLHEGEQYFEYFKTVLPDFAKLEKGSNIFAYAVGHYVQDVVYKRYGVKPPILHFALPEDAEKKAKTANEETKHLMQGVMSAQEDCEKQLNTHADTEKLNFLIAGTYSQVKAQDVLCEAIRKLKPSVLEKTRFYFCGNEVMADETILNAVKKLDSYYDNVTVLHQLTRDEVFDWMRKCDLLLVPSRIDPIPTVAVEMMQVGRPVLCTEVCGIAHYITDGENGFTVRSDDPAALAEKITFLTENYLRKNPKKPDDKLVENNTLKETENCGLSLKEIGENGYKTYKDHFSKEVIARQLKQILWEMTGCDLTDSQNWESGTGSGESGM